MSRESTSYNAIAVIPARYSSSRFPGKALAKISGKPMIQWVYETTKNTKVSKVIVATDDQRIYDCVIGFGGEPVMTSPDHHTGTDRVAEAIADLDFEVVINVQGDEPLLPAHVINDLVDTIVSEDKADMATIAVPIDPGGPEFHDSNVVKVVLDKHNSALYFSRAPIPFSPGGQKSAPHPLKHWGIYAFKKRFLKQFVTWPQGPLERAERLEQLRALENGAKISVYIGTEETVAVDTPDDVQKVEALMSKNIENYF